MDSLTQIVLGAAVGEVVLGKKLGNKAMLWGAIAGTIPDLDVYQSLFFDKLTANELHRGFSHSILFSLIFAPILAWIVSKKEKFTLAFFIPVILGYPFIANENLTVRIVLAAVTAVLLFLVFRNEYKSQVATKWDWTKLFFWSLITHPLLDCHTTWGTQLLWPLKTKLAWNNIFVVDPLYTVPFLIFVVLAMLYNRQSKTRQMLNYIGIAVSSVYMIWSLGVKWYTYGIFEESLAKQNIEYARLTTVPTPFNTFLWSATADADSIYYTGLYSIFDKDKDVSFSKITTNHHLLSDVNDTVTLDRLHFLSKKWYVIQENDGTLMYNDARYGPMYIEEDKPQYGFGYLLGGNKDKLVITQPEPDRGDMEGIFSILWTRIWGK